MSSTNQQYHIPVMLNEVIANLAIKPSGTYVDCTFGGGGHSNEILKHLNREGKLIVFDRDEDVAKNIPNDNRVEWIHENFRYIKRFLKLSGVEKVDGILADLGVSSFQFDEVDKGFTFRADAALDMRMDKRENKTAADIINTYAQSELHKLFEKYGEVTNAKTLAKLVVESREKFPIKKVSDLKSVVQSIVKGNPNRYYAKIFQALRIEVNDEINSLQDLLLQSKEILNEGGRICIISFHSLEDRVVKKIFKTGKLSEPTFEHPFINEPRERIFNIITPKPICTSEDEIRKNPRARSALLRVAEKI